MFPASFFSVVDALCDAVLPSSLHPTTVGSFRTTVAPVLQSVGQFLPSALLYILYCLTCHLFEAFQHIISNLERYCGVRRVL